METIETLPQKIVDQKIVILKSFLDPAKVRSLGEKKKTSLFTKFGFLKPHPNDIQLISLSKYYEPFIVIGGKYSIDYCKRHLFEFKTDSEAQKIYIGGEERKLEPIDATKPNKQVKVLGEERCHYENEATIVMDRLKRDISAEKLHLAPFEDKPENIGNVDLRKLSISPEEEVEYIKSRIVKKPSNVDFVIRENFEINDRMLVYSPIYELVFQELKTSQVMILLIDGVTGESTVVKVVSAIPEKTVTLQIPTITPFQHEKNTPKPNQENPKITVAQDPPAIQNIETKEINRNPPVTQEKTITYAKTEASPFEAEIALFLATDLLKRLGFKNKITPVKVVPEGESYIVELSLRDRVAKVIVNTKTKEVKEYDIQESGSI